MKDKRLQIKIEGGLKSEFDKICHNCGTTPSYLIRMFVEEVVSDLNLDIDHVVHAASMKRIDACELSPYEAIDININGTKNIMDLVNKVKPKSFSYISTDKACLPHTTYGATKYCSEQLVSHFKFFPFVRKFVFRYGNVINSTGSVFHIWKKLYEEGNTLHVTEREMTRFFWYVEEAAEYVLSHIHNLHKVKPVLNFKKLKSVNIYDLVKYLYPDAEININSSYKFNEKTHELINPGYSSEDHVVSPEELFKKYKEKELL